MAKKKLRQRKAAKSDELVRKIVIASSILVVAILAVVAFMWLTGPGVPQSNGTGNETGTNNSQTTQAVTVSISGNAYSQTSISLQVGGSVTWVNLDDRVHDVQILNVRSSPYLSTGEQWTYVFQTAGTYTFRDLDLPFMTGTVTVS